MAVEAKIPNGPLYVDMDGFRLSKCFDYDLFRSSLRYKPREDDMFVVTFPKCGTTWTQHIAHLIFHKGVPPKSTVDFLTSSPFLEMFGSEALELMERPGLIKSHLPYHMMPYHPSAKYIYVCRNPKDVCVSFFYHTRGFAAYDFVNGTLEDFFEVFLEGKNEHGDYFDNVLSWYEHRNDPNVLFIHYEDMKVEPTKYVLEIAKFLDENEHSTLLDRPDILRGIVAQSDIKAMRIYSEANFNDFIKNPLQGEYVPAGWKLLHDDDVTCPSSATFTRKGIVGDWSTHFSPQMNARLEEKIILKLSHTEIVDVWRKHKVM